MGAEPSWRDDIDALAFVAGDGDVTCFVHRLAFRSLLGHEPSAAECLAFFASRRDAFLTAAAAKQQRVATARACNFHLTSRDIERAIASRRASRYPPP